MNIVKTSLGTVQGTQKQGYTLFRGIPFAKPPIGELRFRAPQPAEPWDGVLKAESWPNRSMQLNRDGTGGFYEKEFRDDPEYLTTISEDSLYLNIWTPAESAGDRLPVAFWIHGGAFSGCCGHEKEFNGAEFAKRGIIMVTCNYRLGVFGFLAHPWLSAENKAEGGPGVSGNYGILDQMAALKWVKENIAAFGGDPDRITLFGQSAGGRSVRTLVSSPLTKSLVKGAIIQSAIGTPRDLVLSDAEAAGVQFAEKAGASSLDDLRAMDADRIIQAGVSMMAAARQAGKSVFCPNVDGYVLPDSYQGILESGEIADIPYMVGSNKDDIGAAPAAGDAAESLMYRGCLNWAENRSKKGTKPTYVYYFKRQLPGDTAGAFHSAELWYTFGTLDRSWRPKEPGDYELSERMINYWAEFIKTGSPNGAEADAGAPGYWPACSTASDVMEFDVE